MNINDDTEIISNPEYVRKVFSIRYNLNSGDIMRPKDEDKAKSKGQVEKVSDYRALSRTSVLA